MVDVEKIAINYLFFNPDAALEYLTSGIDKTYFNNNINRSIIGEMLAYYKIYHKPISKIELQQTLEATGLTQDIYGDHISMSTEELADVSLVWLIDSLTQHKKKFMLAKGIQDIINELNNSNIHKAEKELGKIYKSVANISDTKDYVVDVNARMDELIHGLDEGRGGKVVYTGYREFDHLLRGFRPGNLVVVAARPKTGKSQTTVNLISNMVKRKVNVLVFSLEMPKEEYVNLFFSCLTGIKYHKLESRTASVDEMARLNMIQDKMRTEFGKLTIVDSPKKVNPEYIRHKIEEIETKLGITYDVVAIDHATMMKPNQYSGADWVDQGGIAEDLRGIGREMGKVMLVAVQLKRNGAHSAKAKKNIENNPGDDLARSDTWFQTLDVLIAIQQSEEGTTEDSQVDVSTIKFRVVSRHASSATVELIKDFSITSIYSLDDATFKDGVSSFWNPNTARGGEHEDTY